MTPGGSDVRLRQRILKIDSDCIITECLQINALVTPSRKNPSRKNHEKQYNGMKCGYISWQLRGLCGSYGVYVAVTGSMPHSFFYRLAWLIRDSYT